MLDGKDELIETQSVSSRAGGLEKSTGVKPLLSGLKLMIRASFPSCSSRSLGMLKGCPSLLLGKNSSILAKATSTQDWLFWGGRTFKIFTGGIVPDAPSMTSPTLSVGIALTCPQARRSFVKQIFPGMPSISLIKPSGLSDPPPKMVSSGSGLTWGGVMISLGLIATVTFALLL